MTECEERQAKCQAIIRELINEKEKRYEAVLDAKEANSRAALRELQLMIENPPLNDLWPEDVLIDKVDDRFVLALMGERCKNRIDERVDQARVGEPFKSRVKEISKISLWQTITITVVLLGLFGSVCAVWVSLASRISVNEATSKAVTKEMKEVKDALKITIE